MSDRATSALSAEAKIVTLGALAFSAATAAIVSPGRARAVVALGGAVMTLGAAWAMFSQEKRS